MLVDISTFIVSVFVQEVDKDNSIAHPNANEDEEAQYEELGPAVSQVQNAKKIKQ